jgi:hypothetical protein
LEAGAMSEVLIEPDSDPSVEMKPCGVCAEPIRLAAKNCRHCGSYQGRWSRLGLSAAVLSLLVALVSALGFAIPIVKDALTTRDSHLVAAFQGITPYGISVLVSNLGTSPGSINRTLC